MKKISVVGFGKIGQAVVANILNHGVHVTAIDINPGLKKAFESGTYEINEKGLTEVLLPAYKSGQLTITDDFSAIKRKYCCYRSHPAACR
ncbi:MAG: hypothetical protein NVV59_13800 [Chitinophagaceae bacterium]|nr:hypothetical protein [Chitinophagaceae bacterium]